MRKKEHKLGIAGEKEGDGWGLPWSRQMLEDFTCHLHFTDDETEAREVKPSAQGHALAGDTFVICI